MHKPRPKIDRRLLGVWKSDRRRTFKFAYPKPGCPPKTWRKLKSYFGKLIVHWGYGKCRSELNGFKTTDRYEVVACDAESVVVRLNAGSTGAESLRQIYFEGEDYYWIRVGVNHSECFKRMVK